MLFRPQIFSDCRFVFRKQQRCFAGADTQIVRIEKRQRLRIMFRHRLTKRHFFRRQNVRRMFFKVSNDLVTPQTEHVDITVVNPGKSETSPGFFPPRSVKTVVKNKMPPILHKTDIVRVAQFVIVFPGPVKRRQFAVFSVFFRNVFARIVPDHVVKHPLIILFGH